ncbi:hypothetical protein Rhein_0208 [Rheinheimera sp. A13L]|uniref:hypothetical protein n=1 Tax=Rheinheimera sp. A13L TaxID=506534 RepID=UPI0002124CDB|nr:hypothetical protein [Rheinheimera sp. A13L]EGM79748.1 hypothetical protein Rhein_0208 [Rheinheimera sp. A13L]
MAKLTSRNSVNTTPQVVEKKFSPQLLIPCEATQGGESHHHFPEYDAIMARYGVDDVRIVREFEKAISTAQRVWIIDKHLFSEDGKNPSHGRRIKKVVNWFLTNHIQTIRILTGHHDDQAEIEKEFKALEDSVTDGRAKVDDPLKVEISFALKDFDYIHDRFAIIDEELWHFGATVGGFHRDVNAASRGWSADAHKAVQFFDTAWKMANANRKK